jgi:hypothetical protein
MLRREPRALLARDPRRLGCSPTDVQQTRHAASIAGASFHPKIGRQHTADLRAAPFYEPQGIPTPPVLCEISAQRWIS